MDITSMSSILFLIKEQLNNLSGEDDKACGYDFKRLAGAIDNSLFIVTSKLDEIGSLASELEMKTHVSQR